MSIPKEPRQIMINLMYLVLTALLALNVSNEILNAFKTLSISIDRSNRSIDQKNKDVYEQIKANEKAPGQEEKVKPFRIKADSVKIAADNMVNYLNLWKRRITIESGGFDLTPEDSSLHIPSHMDNIDATTHLLVENKGGDTLKEKIIGLRKFLLSQLSNADTTNISPLMPLNITRAKKNDHNPTGDWSIENFEHMPSIAAIALFSKYQNDVRSSEALILNRLFEEAHMKDIKFDTIGAVAVPTQSYALDGDKIDASILLAAFNKSNKPTVKVLQGGGKLSDVKDGVVPWETVASGTGLQTVKGTISLPTDDPEHPIVRDWSFQYMVGTTGASMQLDKMNVFYIGVANPVTIAAAGYSIEDVSLSIPGADVRPDSAGRKGHYNIWVDKPGNLDVAIMAKKGTGGSAKVGGMLVRVKRIPDPVAKLDGKTGGGMAAGLFRIQIAPAPVLDGFDFDVRFQIISFQFSMLPKGRDIQGPYTVENRGGCRLQGQGANPNIVKLMNSARAGDKVFIEGIKAVGPDKKVRELGSLVFTLF